MGVAVVGSPISSGQAPGAATTVTFNVTVPTGSTWLHVQENNAQGSGGVTPTGVTYNGVALTMVPSSSIIASYFESSQWYLANPPTNTSYVLSFTYAVGRNYFGASAIGLSGVNSSTPYGTAVKNASATTIAGATLTVPASTANDLLLATALVYGTGVTPGGGTNL
jgi:hypothetical protein